MMDIIEFQDKLVQFIIYLTWILYIFSFLGLYPESQTYLSILRFFFQAYVSLFLVIRFQPFFPKYSHPITKLDRKLAFLSGIFFLSTVVLEKVKEYIENKTPKLYKKINSIQEKVNTKIHNSPKNNNNKTI